MTPTKEGRRILRILCVPKATEKSKRVVVTKEEIAQMRAELRKERES